MMKYEKPAMEIVEIENEVDTACSFIVLPGCFGQTNDTPAESGNTP